jgi:hypothetical protein
MALDTAWLIARYTLKDIGMADPARVCPVDNYTAQILADGGNWSESEVLGDRAVVKVKAQTATLTTIAADPLINRLPLNALTARLSSLNNNQRSALQTALLDMGYSQAEITARFPDLKAISLGDLLGFAASRRLKPRRDGTGAIVFDGPAQSCRPIDDVDAVVQ